jgi:hypothetical protein
MLRILVSLVLCFSLSKMVLAETVVVKWDSKLEKLKSALPAGWSIGVQGDTLTIEHAEPVWVLRSNFINAPVQDLNRDDLNKEKIIKNGVETRARFVFVIKEKKLLTEAELAKAHYFSKYHALFECSAVGFDTPYARFYPYTLEEQASSIYHVILGENLKSGLGPVYANADYSRP